MRFVGTGALRFTVPVALSVVLASCSSLRVSFPLEAGDADWQVDGGTASRDHVAVDAPLELPLGQAWIYNAGGGFAAGSPLVVDGVVLVGTRQGKVHALSLTEGQKIGEQEFGRSIEGTPAVSHQLLFVPNAWGSRALEAFDLRSGTRTWSYRGIPIEASVLPMGDLVIAGDVEGNVMGIDQKTGQVAWLYEFGEIVSILSGPVASDRQHVAVADETGRVALLQSDTGEEIWMRKLNSPVEATLSAGAGLIFVPTTRGKFVALRSADGTTAWEFDARNDEVRFSSAAVTSDHVFFGATDGTLRSVRIEDGSPSWTFHTDGAIVAAPVVTGNIVFTGAMDQKIYGVRRDNGSIQWEAKLRGRVKSAPAVRDGYLIVLSEPRYVYAFANAANIRD